MRRFHSYGPVDCEEHFCVQRSEMIQKCTGQLVGKPGKSGHYFTIWAPRQAGKTWLMRQVKKKIEAEYPEKFIIGTMSMQRIIMDEDEPDDVFLEKLPRLFEICFKKKVDSLNKWDEWADLFSKDKKLFDKPVIFFIDEFDKLRPSIIDRLVTLFRDIYLERDTYMIHGLALIGVRAVLGVESDRGSPFNIQRSLHVPNLTWEEVKELYRQYQDESGQKIEPEVVGKIYETTRGQPGLVSWFGELLTEKYNPGVDKIIDKKTWENVYEAALHVEWNNTVLNLIKKAQGKYVNYVIELFGKSDLPFNIRAEWCSYLYLNGIIADKKMIDANGRTVYVCRFSSQFVQECLYGALALDLVGDRLPILALEPLDELNDVFEGAKLNLPALLQRYKDYLKRLKTKGLNPWKDQPRRADLHLTEAVGHFHLYSWLQNAIGWRCIISPEFPTGNGKVDIHLKCKDKAGIIEVKSFIDASQIKEAKNQAAKYAKQTGLDSVTIALFVPVEDEEILKKLSGKEVIENIEVNVCAIGWV